MHCNGSVWILEEGLVHASSWLPRNLGKVMLLILVREKLYETAGQSLRVSCLRISILVTRQEELKGVGKKKDVAVIREAGPTQVLLSFLLSRVCGTV